MKSRDGKVRKKNKSGREKSRSEKEKHQKKEDREPPGQMRSEKLFTVVAKHIPKSKCATHTILGPIWKFGYRKIAHGWALSTSASQNAPKESLLTTFRSLDVKKLARSTCPSQNAHNEPHFETRIPQKKMFKSKCQQHERLGHFWKITCRKKYTPLWQDTHFKSKWQDHMPKNCTLFWQKTHFQVKMSKAWWTETFLEGHMLHGVAARSTSPSQNAPKTCLRTTFKGSGVEKLARMSKSKCPQQTTFGKSNRGFQTTFWKIICRKNPMWQEGHFEVKCQNIKGRTTFRGSHPEKNCYCGRKHFPSQTTFRSSCCGKKQVSN